MVKHVSYRSTPIVFRAIDAIARCLGRENRVRRLGRRRERDPDIRLRNIRLRADVRILDHRGDERCRRLYDERVAQDASGRESPRQLAYGGQGMWGTFYSGALVPWAGA